MALLIEKLISCSKIHHPLEYGSLYDGILHQPRASSALSKFLRKRGKQLPRSYKTFLKMHNGWSGYAAGFTLVGIGGKHTAEARRDIRETLDLFLDAWKAQYGEPTAEKVAEVEGWSRNEGAYIVRMIPFGTDFNGALLLFDPKARRKDGEMDVLLYDTSGPSRRYRGFVNMLRTDLREMYRETRNLRKANATVDGS